MIHLNPLQSQGELNALKMSFQRLESELKHSHSSGDRKEQDFSMAIKARDNALKEVAKLQNQLEILGEREKQKVGLQTLVVGSSFHLI